MWPMSRARKIDPGCVRAARGPRRPRRTRRRTRAENTADRGGARAERSCPQPVDRQTRSGRVCWFLARSYLVHESPRRGSLHEDAEPCSFGAQRPVAARRQLEEPAPSVCLVRCRRLAFANESIGSQNLNRPVERAGTKLHGAARCVFDAGNDAETVARAVGEREQDQEGGSRQAEMIGHRYIMTYDRSCVTGARFRPQARAPRLDLARLGSVGSPPSGRWQSLACYEIGARNNCRND